MIQRLVIAFLLMATFATQAQTNSTALFDDLLDMGQQFLEENVDEDVLAQVGQLNEKKVRELLQQLQEQFDQDYVLDLATLKDAASAGLTLLASSPDTEPYAEWLRPRLDYFDVASELDQSIPLPKPTPTQPKPPKPAPTTRQTSKAWASTVKARPRPAAAAQYEARLKAVFQRQGVPKELFWLAEIESGFNPKAQSPAGAVGMYQLMPTTAKSLGLSTWPLDERKNAEKSADAAARHLRDLHKQFQDWPLAIAAYNAGAGRVKSKLDGKKRTFDDIASKLPSETQLYVPKFNAVLQLREGKSLDQLGKS